MASNKVGVKRSIFKKPAWASTTGKTTEEDTPIFGQAHLYQDILENDKARRKRQAAKQKERAQKEKREEEERESKRRRISIEAEDSDYGSDSDIKSTRSGTAESQRSQKSSTPVESERPISTKNSPMKQKSRLIDQPDIPPSPQTRSRTRRPPTQDKAIILDDESPTEDPIEPRHTSEAKPKAKPSKSNPKPKEPVSEPESEEEDEYLRELKAKAKLEAQAKRINARTSQENTPTSPSTRLKSPVPGNPTSPSLAQHSPPSHLAPSSNLPADNNDESEVKIWIKTIIPGAKEVIVNRKISQPLDKVKDFWIKRNELDPSIAERVFFTWNGTRLYNSTTMRGIIERLKKTHPTRDGRDPSDGKIVIEAVTDEIFVYRQEQRARRLAEAEKKAAGNDDRDNGESGDNGDGDTAVPQQPQKPSIVIKLKAEGYEEVNIRVYEHTTIGKILNGYRKLQKIEAGTQGWLSYEGDRLDEGATVEEVGFEHEDSVEVYLR